MVNTPLHGAKYWYESGTDLLKRIKIQEVKRIWGIINVLSHFSLLLKSQLWIVFSDEHEATYKRFLVLTWSWQTPVYSKICTLPLSRVSTVLSALSILLLATRQLPVKNLNYRVSNVKGLIFWALKSVKMIKTTNYVNLSHKIVNMMFMLFETFNKTKYFKAMVTLHCLVC